MEPFIGTIAALPFTRTTGPIGWVPCDGRLLSIADYQVLFTLIGTTYGGNGVSTFGVPDLRSRVPVGLGKLTGGSQYTLGETNGVEAATITNAQMPTHTHALAAGASTGSVSVSDQPGTSSTASPGTATLGVFSGSSGNASAYNNLAPNINLYVGTTAKPATVSAAGGNLPIELIQPSLPVYYYIATAGLFPSQS